MISEHVCRSQPKYQSTTKVPQLFFFTLATENLVLVLNQKYGVLKVRNLVQWKSTLRLEAASRPVTASLW